MFLTMAFLAGCLIFIFGFKKMLVELKNGETYNGHLVNCDAWMNIHLRLALIFFNPNILDLF
ncbi:hypothetical protein Peur_025210 [Populus x canadensis]